MRLGKTLQDNHMQTNCVIRFPDQTIDLLKMKTSGDLLFEINALLSNLSSFPLDERVELINQIRREIQVYSPFKDEPVDCVQWVKSESVTANDYNPNSVAPPEMALLEVSIAQDGYTQPIVTWDTGAKFEVIDGFHRHRVGKESKTVSQRIGGYLPIVIANQGRTDITDRMASTIRHNRARGKHRVEAMSDIVVELKRRNWSDEKISKHLGMDQDEILRLCQITGLTELFQDQDFSKSWDVEGEITESDFVELSDDISTYGEEAESFRTVNTSDSKRVFHTYDKWECYKAGFYNNTVPGKTKSECEEIYRDFLSDIDGFSEALQHVVTEWENSCEHYLTNSCMNRIAWLGQASVCYAKGIPSAFRGGFFLLTEDQQKAANERALVFLNRWLVSHGMEQVTMEQAYSGDRQSDIY